MTRQGCRGRPLHRLSSTKMTGFMEPAFKMVKLDQPSFFIWRIENLEVRAVPRDHHGSFYEGDSYIIYNASVPAQGRKMENHIHFWLGQETTADEAFVAAKKTIELDDQLGGSPVQHREVQGFESARFKSYFKSGMRILKGGVATGLRHVNLEFAARLFQVKGKRSPVLTEQGSVSWSHFNSGDCFILETMTHVFVWVGEKANKMEKMQAAKVAMQLRDERVERQIVIVDEGTEGELSPAELAEFKKHLPLEERVIKPAEQDSDVVAETVRNQLKLYRCNDDSGICQIIQEKEGALYQSDLNSKDSFIIDNGERGIWVWVGRKASADERREAMKHAEGFLEKKGYPKGTAVTRVIDCGEPTEFKMLFTNWKDSVATDPQPFKNKIAPTVNKKFDAAVLHSTPSLAADTQLVDDGTGDLTVWRLHDKELELVPNELFGVFFDGDCYLLHYAYKVGSRTNHILYYWLGAHSAQDERGTIAWHTIKKDEEMAGTAVQVRVVQGKEPPHFLTILGGKMIVFKGGYASSFDGANGQDTEIPETFLIQVRGGDSYSTRAVQVEHRASALNSNDVFVLAAGDATYVWCGKGSTGDERERAKVIAAQWASKGELVVVSEGKEKEEFWLAFPEGKETYADDDRLKNTEVRVPARLFQCSNATGVFKAEEIFDFAQSDLVPDDVMVLDTGSAVFIWIGVGANKEERRSVAQLVHEYLLSDPKGRDIDTPMIQVQQGHEPPNFTGFFGTWDSELWTGDDFETLRSQFESVIKIQVPEQTKNDEEVTKYPLDVLQVTDPEKLPEDVDPLNKELHLTNDDFIATFRMEREEFNSLPQWRKNNFKKAAKLF